jgi:transposase InsO family protein
LLGNLQLAAVAQVLGDARCPETVATDAREDVGSKGDSYDNALAEPINGLYKANLIHRGAPWKTKEAVELATLEWAAWFNNHRLPKPIGYIPQAEAEANYYQKLTSQAIEVAA